MQNTEVTYSETKKRFGLSVLVYIVTSNHVHLLVRDSGANVYRWSEAIAVDNLNFVERVKSELGFKAAHQPQCGGSTVQKFKSST
jgi:hypothetical protein